MLVFAFLVATSFPVGKAITNDLEPEALTFVRFVMAVAMFAAIAVFAREKMRWPDLRQWLVYLFLAAIMTIFFVSMFEALRWTDALSAGAVFTLTPFFTGIISLVLFGQKMSRTGFLALLIASLTSLWIVFKGDIGAMLSLRPGKGETIFLVGCIVYAGYAPAVKKLHNGDGLINLTVWILVCGALILMVYGWPEIYQTGWRQIPGRTFLAIGWLALFTTVASFYLIQYASLRLPGVKVMSYLLLIPGFVLLQGLGLGNPLPAINILIALGVLGVAMAILQKA